MEHFLELLSIKSDSTRALAEDVHEFLLVRNCLVHNRGLVSRELHSRNPSKFPEVEIIIEVDTALYRQYRELVGNFAHEIDVKLSSVLSSS